MKRSVAFEKGDDALKLRYFIMVAFADVGLDKLPPANVELLKYDEGVRDYVPLPLDTILEENVQVKVELKDYKVKCTVLYLYDMFCINLPCFPLLSFLGLKVVM